MDAKYVIWKGMFYTEIIEREVLAGFDWETGEEVYETEYSAIGDTKEEVIAEFKDYNFAVYRYTELVDEFSKSMRWPWNEPHYSINKENYITEFTDGEDAIWYKLERIET